MIFHYRGPAFVSYAIGALRGSVNPRPYSMARGQLGAVLPEPEANLASLDSVPHFILLLLFLISQTLTICRYRSFDLRYEDKFCYI